jgi:hypothetical protein
MDVSDFFDYGIFLADYHLYPSVDGTEGLAPHIPPNARLTFDLTLLGFRPRSQWVSSSFDFKICLLIKDVMNQVKPLLQDISTNEFPYHQDMKQSLELARKAGMEKNAVLIYSSSILLNDEEAAAAIGKMTTKLT